MKAIIVDDENLAIVYLEHQLKQIGGIELAGKFTNPLDVIPFIQKEEVDVVFLDIQFAGVNGMELAEQIVGLKKGIQIVFVTAYAEYAIKAFELHAIDYVIKPVGLDRLSKTLQRIQERLGALSYNEQPEAHEQMHVKLFSHFHLETDKRIMAPFRWRTTKAQELFLFFLQHRSKQISKASLIEMLWPELDSTKAYAQLYTAVYHIRKTLAPCEKYFQLVNTSNGYMLTVEHVQIDTEVWETFIMMGLPVSHQTIRDYERHMELYTGEYLQEMEYLWLESDRQRLRALWIRTAIQMAEWYASSNQYDRSVEMYTRICSLYPHAEEAHFALMKLYASKGRPSAVSRQYLMLREALIKELNEEPSPYITEWYRIWKQENKE
ncbi:response regulator [Paenibacillus tarimensis]|uniref:response regulator n=1 Tax=Paenibacillus tarimensis TaxID=416012 RepID=UPI001F1C14B3|nr:response regulator [Paenibacillus tarimensis]MCF2946040.1 response regulator [Paenibacillus tarimensis]